VAADVRERLTFVPVECMDEVLGCALREARPLRVAGTPHGIAHGAPLRAPATPHLVADPLPPTGRVARPRGRGEGEIKSKGVRGASDGARDQTDA